MCRIKIRVNGEIDKDKMSEETTNAIVNAAKKLVKKAKVEVFYEMDRQVPQKE